MTGDEWREEFESEITKVLCQFDVRCRTGLDDFVMAKLVREYVESLASAIDWQSDINKTEE